MSELDDSVEIDVNGQTFFVVPLPPGLVEAKGVAVRTALVSDRVEELTSPKAFQEAAHAMLTSVQRRGLTPRGAWAMGSLPADWPLWRDHLATEIADRVQAKLTEINGHVMIYALFDSADVTLD